MKLATTSPSKTGLAIVFALLTGLSIFGTAHAESAFGPLPKIGDPGARCPAVSQEDLTNEMVAESLGVSLERLENVKLIRNLDLDAVCTMPSTKLTRAFLKAEDPKPDSPGEWASFRAMQQSVDGVVRPDGLYQGFVQRQALVQAQRSAVSSVAGISNGGWTSIGPGNIGGRIRAIAINPNVPSTLFIGGVAGGIWKSTDSGATWAPINDFMSNLAISSLVYDPANPAIMYAGTGEGFFNADSVRGFGIFKSTDGGATWSLLSNTNPTTAGSDWYYVNRLAVNGNVLLAATRGGLYRSADSGATWTKTYNTTSSYGAMDVKFDPNNANNAVLGDKGGVTSYTTNGGVSWTAAAAMGSSTGFYGRVEVAYAKSMPGTVYASVDASNGQVYKSVNGGATWALVSTPAHTGGQGWYDNVIWVDPTNANHLLVGGLDIKRSTDGGATFANISTWYYSPASAHADHHAIVADPGYDGSTNRKIYFGNDGGIYRATDITLVNANASSNGWTNLNNGLAITQFYGGAGHASAGPKIAGGTQDNGSLVYNGVANSWGTMFGGDGGYSAADSVDPNYFYGEYVYLNIHRSSNGGASSSYIYTGITDANSSGANFIAPFILDPNNNNRMLGGGLSLWESVNVKAATPTWASKKPSTGQKISAITVAEGNADIVWVGHNDGSVYKTINATAATPTWTQVRTAVGRTALRILIDKDNYSIVYVTYGGYAAANVWRTADAGTNWTDISGVLPQVPVRGFARYPANANWLYAGTEVGVFASTNAGTTWSAINDGPANVSVDELFWFDSTTLVAVTHGRGMFKATVSTLPSYALSVSRTGSGKVTAADLSIDCGATCTANYVSGTVVTLTAVPTPGATFNGWGGACSGTAGCTVTMNAVSSVSANFTTVPDFPPGGVMPAGWVQGGGSNAAWSVVSDSTYSGTYGLRAGAIANSQISSITYTGNFTAGLVSFARRVSSEGGFDHLRFYIDNVELGSWSGEVPWGVVSYAITAGNHTVKWEYSKDVSDIGGADTAWIDEVYLPLAGAATNAGAAIVPWLYLILLSD